MVYVRRTKSVDGFIGRFREPQAVELLRETLKMDAARLIPLDDTSSICPACVQKKEPRQANVRVSDTTIQITTLRFVDIGRYVSGQTAVKKRLYTAKATPNTFHRRIREQTTGLTQRVICRLDLVNNS